MKFKLPELGENIEKAEVVSVNVSEGDHVKEEQALIEIETDKATMEVPSPCDGVITKMAVSEGDTLSVGDLVSEIDDSEDEGDQEKDQTSDSAESSDEKEKEKDDDDAADESESEDGENGDSSEKSESEDAEESHEEEDEPDNGTDDEPESDDDSTSDEPPPQRGRFPVFASPSTRIFAREIGVEISDVTGSGPGGRISIEDIKRYARHNRTAPSQKSSAGDRRQSSPLPDLSQWGEIKTVDMPSRRQATADRMVQSWTEIPQVTLHAAADATRLEESVERLRSRVEIDKGVKLTLTAAMTRIVAGALSAFPEFRASVDYPNRRLIRLDYCHVSIAVDTDKGLVAPVVRDADRKSISQLAVDIHRLANRARTGKLSPKEMAGGVFTLTNLGVLGTGHFTPIVTLPQVSILGIGKIDTVPVFDESKRMFEPRRHLPLSLSFDHRAVDGANGARFLKWITEAIEEPLLISL